MPAPDAAPATPRAETAPASHRIRGTVLDADRRTPLRGASVWAGQLEAVTDAEGRFALEVPAEATLIVKAPGYEMRRIPAVGLDVAVTLKPKSIRAAYLTYYGIAEPSIRNRVLELVDRTELNAVVIDVKGDRGLIPYRTEVPAALEAGALGPVIIKDFDGMLRSFRERGIYTIARIVAFKDNVLAKHRPDLAIIDTRTGKPWIDNEKLAWVDPFREEVWDYLIAIAKEAVAKGFDEVQFDYVRFPTDGRLSAAAYAQPNTSATRLPAIAGFLAKARRELGPTGAFLSADVFGYTAFNANDTDIGQRVEELAPHLDYICPMVYPSGYHLGIPGFRNPVTHPYEVVRESVRLIRQRTQHTAVQVRPWLQDFRDYAFDRRIFGTREIRAQIKGASDGGGVGFMLWNPRNDYTAQALLPKTGPCRRRSPYRRPGPTAAVTVPKTRAYRRRSPCRSRDREEAARLGVSRIPLLVAAGLLLAGAASAEPLAPNELGRVMILEYHKIDRPEGRWTRTPENFRRDLRALWERGYRLVALNDYLDGTIRLPRGTSPVILTFDDSSPGQFRYLERNGDWVLDPDCAVGILEAFEREHPGFGHAATFYVLPGADRPNRLFDQPELATRKLQYLASRGYEIGNHTLWHATLSRYPESVVRQQVASAQDWIQRHVPGYRPRTLALPMGAYPREVAWVVAGQVNGSTYRHDAILMVSGGPAPAPRAKGFDRQRLPRIQAVEQDIAHWLTHFDRHPDERYVSPGP